MMIKHSGTALWSGGLKDGNGRISTESGVLDNVQYGFHTRFEGGPGTNPEELIGAAHAGCFTMALAAQLSEDGMTAKSLMTTATVTLEKVDEGYTISAVHLNLVAVIPGANEQAFEHAALKAKLGCPVSKLLSAHITLDARLETDTLAHAHR
ncbi:MAG: OsmC family protein [Sphingomonadaceae bacterium]